MRVSSTGVRPPVSRAVVPVVALAATMLLVTSCGDSSVLPIVSVSPSPAISSPPTPSVEPPPTTSATKGWESPSAESPAATTPLAPRPTATAVAVPAHWERAGSPDVGNVLGAVRLANGRVLVLGESEVAIWNPATGAWRRAGDLNKYRSEFALVALPDGRALVAGGLNADSQSYSSAYLFDPATRGWTKTGLMRFARALPAAAVLADGRVLVAGGYYGHRPRWAVVDHPAVVLAAVRADRGTGAPSTPGDIDPPDTGTAMATAEVFDPSTGTWSSTGNLRFARYGAQAVRLADGRVLVVGSSGPNVTGGSFDTAELYDPATGRFTLTGPLPGLDARAAATSQRAPRWAVDLLPKGTSVAGIGMLVALADGGAVLIGNHDDDPHARHQVVYSLRYDVAAGTWSEIGEPWISSFDENASRGWESSTRNVAEAAVAPLADGRVLVAGGGQGRGVAAYNPRADAWANQPQLPKDLFEPVAVPFADGSVLVVDHWGAKAYRFVPKG